MPLDGLGIEARGTLTPGFCYTRTRRRSDPARVGASSARGTLGGEVTELAAFLGVAVVVIVTPGPDTALTIRNTLLGGRRSGVLTAAGVALGRATWTLATAAGVAALLAVRSESSPC